MKKFTTALMLSGALLVFNHLNAQRNNSNDTLNTRVDNLGYWEKAAEKGLTDPNPVMRVPPASYTGDQIRAISVITENSPDVVIVEGSTSQSENSIFVNPSDNDNVLNSNNSTNTPGGSITLYGADDLYTFDGAENWEGEIQGAGGSNQGDPATAISHDGRWYVGYIKNNGQWVSYSDNEGDTWTQVNVANAPTGFSNLLDKNHMWIDNSSSSQYQGNLYDAWTTFGGQNDNDIEISVSSTNGESWNTPINVSNNLNAGSHCQGVNITTGPNGEAYALFAIYDNWPSDEDALALARSFDGGLTWESFRILDNIRGIRTSETSKNMRVNSFPCITADISTGPNRGNIYAIWTNIGVPGVNTGSDIDVYMIRSEDQGTTWSDPIRVNQDDQGLGNEHFMPWIDSDPVSGTLSAVFYDDRNVGGSQCEVYCAVSYDAGDSWEDFKVSDVSFTPTPIPGLASGYFGDYLGITSYGGKVYPVWTDNRTGVALAYTSPFTTSTMTAPTDLVAELDEGIGEVTLSWQHPLGPTFDHFKIYRNFMLIGTSVLPTFVDTLPNYGHYRYMVTAYYTIEGESGAAISDVQWGNAQASVDPGSVEQLVLPASTATATVDIMNNGELPLNFTLGFSLPATVSDDSRAYCSADGGCGEFIHRVKIGDIDNYTECSGYSDFTDQSTTLVGGITYDLRIENGLSTQPGDLCGVWIDWNQNTIFTDDEPVVMQGSPGIGPYTASITVPENAATGTTRMRVRIIRSGTLSACGITQYGEVEDYTLNVINWISAAPEEGSVDPGESAPVTLTFSSGTLPLGAYNINLDISSNDPDDPIITVPVTMNVQDILLAVTADKDSLCEGAATHLYANVTGGSGSETYLWTSDPAGFSSTEQNPVVSPGVTTTYFVEVTDGSVVLNEQITITVMPLPEVDLGPDAEECQGGSATFDAGAGYMTYQWNNGSTEQSITVDQAGVYWVEVSNNYGCVNRDTVNFTLNPLPAVDLGPDATFCEGTTYTLNAGAGFSTYHWSTGENSAEIVVNEAGKYWVDVIDVNGCPATDTIELAVDLLPGITSVSSGPETVDNFLNSSSDYTATDAENAEAYIWTLEPASAGTIEGSGTTAQVSWDEGFTGIASVFVHAQNGCGDGPASGEFTTEVFTSQGIIESAISSAVKVFPNPNNGSFSIAFTSAKEQELRFQVISSQGRILMNETQSVPTGNYTRTYQLGHLPAGNYSLRILDKDGRMITAEGIVIQ